MRPAEVLAAFPEPQVYEEWMGGNLNMALLFHGLVLYFSDCDGRAPLPDSTLGSIEISHREDAYLFDRPMGEWNKETLVPVLEARGYEILWLPHGLVVPQQLELSFDEDERLVCVDV